MGFPSHSVVKILPAMQETQVWSLSQEDLEEGMATHSGILAWRIPRTEYPGGLQSMRSQSRTGPKWLSTCARKIWSLGSDEQIQGKLNSKVWGKGDRNQESCPGNKSAPGHAAQQIRNIKSQTLTHKKKFRGRSQDGRGVGWGEHFLPHKFIKRTFKRRVNSTKQLLNAGRGHQAPRKATQVFKRR